MLQRLDIVKEQLHQTHPLIHCITSPIAVNDCANAILALGAQPVMAEHPLEVAGITATARALTVSLANITDARLESMHIAGKKARECGIPSLIDLVGITCSPLRMEHAKKFIREARPAVLKGNYSEIRAIAGDMVSSSSGIDVSSEDMIHSTEDERLGRMQEMLCRLAREEETVVMATGPIDLISDGRRTICIRNGHPLMARVTGTGCTLTCITGAYLAVSQPMEACLYATLNWDISGERAAKFVEERGLGLGFYHVALMDALSMLTAQEISCCADMELVE